MILSHLRLYLCSIQYLNIDFCMYPAMTAYNPSVLCLHEMMKTQVELVKNFADLQKIIYQSCLGGIKEDFKYTTLEDTKEVSKLCDYDFLNSL